MNTIELTSKEVFDFLLKSAQNDEFMTAAIEEISKPVSEDFLKQPIAICPKCHHFQIECICND